jgi:hypothetical protein
MLLSAFVSRSAKTLEDYLRQEGIAVTEQWCQETAKHMLGLKSWNLPTRPVHATAVSILTYSAAQAGVQLTLAQAKEAVERISRFEKDPEPESGPENTEPFAPTPDGL